MRFNRKLALCAAAAAVGLGASNVQAKQYNWTGEGVNGNWSTLANWGLFSTSTPGSTDDARFGDTTSLRAASNVDTNRTIEDFFVDGSAGSVGNFVFTGANTTLTVNDQFAMDQPNPVLDSATISTGLTVNTNSVLLEQDSHLTLSAGGTLIAAFFGMSNPDAGPRPTLVIASGSTLSLASGNGEIDSGVLQLNSGGQFSLFPNYVLTVTGSTSALSLLTNWAVPPQTTVKVLSGATIPSTTVQFNVGVTDSGTLLVDGPGSYVTAGGGVGSFWGWKTGGVASITISNSAYGNYTTGLNVGIDAKANVNINSNGELFVENGLIVGANSDSVATITLNTATLVVGNGTNDFALFGKGSTLNLQTRGVLVTTGNATFAAGSTVAISGGTLSAVGSAQFDSAGSTNLSGGWMNLSNGGTFEAGSTFNWSGGSVSIGSGKTLTFTGGGGTLGVGTGLSNGATVHMTNGAVINGAYLDIGSTLDGGANGTLLIDVAGTKYTNSGAYTDLGLNAGDSGTMTISSSGAASFNAGLHLAGNGGKALLTLSSAGVLNVAGLISGNSAAGSAATINISGGTLNSTGTSVFQSGSAVTLSSGGMMLGDNATFSSGSNLNWTGGSLSIASGRTLTFDAGTGTIATDSGLSNGATIRVTNAAHVTNSSYMDVGNSLDGGANGTLLIDGAGSSYITTANVFNYTLFGFNNGDFGTLTISNSGAGTFTALHLAGNGGKALVTVSSGSLNFGTLLQAGGTLSTSAATINISGGILNSMGTALFEGGALVNLTSGTASFAGNATFSSGSTLNWSAGSLSLAAGKILEIDGVGTLSPIQSYTNGSTLSIGTGALVNSNQFNIGGAGTGTLLVIGTNARLASTTNFGQSTIGNGGTLIVSGGGAATFTSNVFIGTGGLKDGTGGGFIQVGPNGDTINGDLLSLGSSSVTTHMNVIGGTVNVTGVATLSGSTVVNYQSGSFNIGSTLTTANTSGITVGSGAVLRSHGLSMNDTSTMNLSGGFIDDYSGGTLISTIRGYLLAGRNGGLGGLWKGAGINSSTAAGSPNTYAVGYADASAIGSPTTFMGQSIDNTSVLARLAYLGDANLDGTVNALDFNALATNYGKTPGSDVWTQGDFNYDGTVNSADFAALAANYGQTIPGSADLPDAAAPAAMLPLGAVVPEPATIASLVALGALLRRRRVANTLRTYNCTSSA